MATVVIAVLTYFLARYSSDQGGISDAQTAIQQQQLSFSEVEERPWVFVSKAEITSGLTFDQFGGAAISIRFTVKNVGHTPAERLFISPDIFNIPNGWSGSAGSKTQAVCASSKIQPSLLEPGVTVFPGQETEIESAVRIKPNEVFNAAYPAKPPAADAVVFAWVLAPIIVGCVDYFFGWEDGDRHHQTPFSYALLKQNKSHPASSLVIDFGPNTRVIPAETLSIEPRPIDAGSSQAD